nr:MAG TPA: Small hydrophilic plant seed protein [Caudoviricetes sp.]
MAETKAGGLKAAATNIERYGKDFYKEMGRKGGEVGKTGGFAANRELAKRAGRIGGLKSKRGKAKTALAA